MKEPKHTRASGAADEHDNPDKVASEDIEYADPGYLPDKHKRYPLDTREHVHQGWAHINQSEHSSRYKAEDLSRVKAKLREAHKRFGIPLKDYVQGEEGMDEEGADEEESQETEEEKKQEEEGETEAKAIECRAAVPFSTLGKNEVLFLPVGIHQIKPIRGGIGKPIKVLVNIESALAVEQQRSEINARTGKRPYFDFNHEDGPASFWPTAFSWRHGEGVVAKGEWSASGKRAVEGKDFRAFSPVFHVDNKLGDPARVICSDMARPNMGGLVNDPAFTALPLWAKNDGTSVNAGVTATTTKTKEKKYAMTSEEIAALRAKNTELETKIEALKDIVSKDEADSTSKAQLEAAESNQRATLAEIEAGELKMKLEAAEDIVRKRNKSDAEEVVKAAVKRGAIPPKDIRMQNDLVARATADPSFKAIIAKMTPGGYSPDQRLIHFPRPGDGDSRVSIVNDDPRAVFAKMARVLSESTRAQRHEDKVRLSEEFAAIYAGSFAETPKNAEQRVRMINARLDVMREAIEASDVIDVNLGTISGTLVTQRTLELLKFVFPALSRFTTDFSDQPALFNQTVMTRIVTIPQVITYSTATGWQDTVAATTDVPVVINNHRGIPITFNEQLLASTMRRLFNEFAEASAYALAKALVDLIYSLFTDANYTNNYIVTSAAFARGSVVDIGVQLTIRGVPLGLGNRTMLLWPAAFGSLVKDTALITYAAYQQPTIITEGVQPNAAFPVTVDTFQVYTAPNMPSNNANLVGFAGSRSAVVICTRVPNDYTSILPGASFGNVQIVSDPDLGMSVMQVQYVNHVLGTATSRLALMYGAAAGQTAAGQMIKAAAGTGSAR